MGKKDKEKKTSLKIKKSNRPVILMNFDGTVSRKDYAYYFLPAFIVCLIPVIGPLALLLPNIGFGIRRLRDLNLPIWLILLPVIPVVGVIALLLLFLRNK